MEKLETDQTKKEQTKFRKDKIEKIIQDLIESEVNLAIGKNENDKLRKLIIETLKAFDLTSYDYVTQIEKSMMFNETRVTLVSGNTIVYDLEKVKENLGKERSQLFIKKSFSLINVEDFKELLIKYGVPNKEIKKYIQKTEMINEDNLKKAYDLGEVTIDELQGAYTVTPKKEYLRLTNNQKGIKHE